MLTYTYDSSIIEIRESANEQDVEFRIRALGGDAIDAAIRRVQGRFEQNDILSDVYSYVYKNHEYQFIVRQDFYVEFILALMKYQLLLRVQWDE